MTVLKTNWIARLCGTFVLQNFSDMDDMSTQLSAHTIILWRKPSVSVPYNGRRRLSLIALSDIFKLQFSMDGLREIWKGQSCTILLADSMPTIDPFDWIMQKWWYFEVNVSWRKIDFSPLVGLSARPKFLRHPGKKLSFDINNQFWALKPYFQFRKCLSRCHLNEATC